MMLIPQVASAALLRPNERMVQVWRAGLEKDSYDPEEAEHGTYNVNGLLIATDQRSSSCRRRVCSERATNHGKHGIS